MPRFAANLTMLFTELPFLDRFEAAAAAGFEAVEFLFPYGHPAREIRDRLDANGLQLVLHNLPAGNWDAGERDRSFFLRPFCVHRKCEEPQFLKHPQCVELQRRRDVHVGPR